MKSLHPQRSLWRNHNFLLLWGGEGLSMLGTTISSLALPFLILSLTHSLAQAGIASAVGQVPFVLFGLFAGVMVDRWNRKLLMIICESVSLLAMSSIAIALAWHNVTIIQIDIVQFLIGTSYVFYSIAEVASISSVVEKRQLGTAMGYNEAMFSGSSLIGAPLGGILLRLNLALPFVADAVSYIFSLTSLILIRIPFQQERTLPRQQILLEMRDGLQWIWRKPVFRAMMLFSCCVNFIFGGVLLMLIALTQYRVAANQQASVAVITGTILASGGIGGLCSSFLSPWIQRRFAFAPAILTTVWIEAGLFTLLPLMPTIPALAVCFTLLMINSPIVNVVAVSYRLALIPDALQGRVNSAYRTVGLGLQPLRALIAGFALQRFGAVVTVLGFGYFYLVVVLVFTIVPAVRHAPPLVNAEVANATP